MPGTWTPLTGAPTAYPVNGFYDASVAIAGFIYWCDDFHLIRYSIGGDSWVRLADLPDGAHDTGALYANSVDADQLIYISDGHAHVYSRSGDTWTGDQVENFTKANSRVLGPSHAWTKSSSVGKTDDGVVVGNRMSIDGGTGIFAGLDGDVTARMEAGCGTPAMFAQFTLTALSPEDTGSANDYAVDLGVIAQMATADGSDMAGVGFILSRVKNFGDNSSQWKATLRRTGAAGNSSYDASVQDQNIVDPAPGDIIRVECSPEGGGFYTIRGVINGVTVLEWGGENNVPGGTCAGAYIGMVRNGSSSFAAGDTSIDVVTAGRLARPGVRRYLYGAATLDDGGDSIAYMIAGYDLDLPGDGNTVTCEKIDSTNIDGTYVAIPDCPYSGEANCAVVHGEIWAFVFDDAGGNPLRIASYNADDDAWTSQAALATALATARGPHFGSLALAAVGGSRILGVELNARRAYQVDVDAGTVVAQDDLPGGQNAMWAAEGSTYVLATDDATVYPLYSFTPDALHFPVSPYALRAS